MKLVKINYSLFIILIISTLSPFPQSSVKLMNYNLLNNPGTDTTTRNPYFRDKISSANPFFSLVFARLSFRPVPLGLVRNLTSDIYFYRIIAGNISVSKRLFVLR
ncbi:hypothetical protein LJE82_03690 [bacterium BMS3Abin03]|nr:hypothetical protein [bacterium BMS3Abin03]